MAAAPEPAAVLDRLVAAEPVGPERLALVRRTCAAVHGLVPLPVGDRTSSPAVLSSDDDEAVVEFATQFSADVAGMDDGVRGRFLTVTGDAAFPTVQAIYVADMVPRVRAALDALFGPSEWSAPVADPNIDTWATIDELLVVVHQLDGLDPVTAEVVRLSGARQHDCRLCRSLRSRPALIAGGDDDLWAAIDRPETLGPPHRAALGLVDAMIWTPARIGSDVVDDVRTELTRDQAVELVLDVMRNAANKIAVAFGADAPNVTDGVEVYEIDADGVAQARFRVAFR